MNSLLLREGARQVTSPPRRRRGAKLSLALFTLLVLLGLPLLGALVGTVRGGLAAAGPSAAAQATCATAPTNEAAAIRNAALIASVGAGLGVSQAGQVIAVGTAIVESGVRNLASAAVPESANYPNDGVAAGDHDSVGLFQQRASWGTVAQRMDPATSARLFYERLLGLPGGWESMPPGDAAQAVQVSAFPDRYAGQMGPAAALLAAGGLVKPCTPGGIAGAGAGGFADGPGGAGAGNSPRTAAEAIAWARGQAASGTGGWYRRCLAFVAQSYGWSYSGVNYAIDHFTVVPPANRHAADSPEGRTPPPGAALYWDTGSRAGHIALYLGGGELASNDILVNGQISVVPASMIESKWGARYVGWTDPGVFPLGG